MTQNELLINGIQRSAKELTLVYYDFKCAKCETEENLQWHHLIKRSSKAYMDFGIYIAQRNYWANITVLCANCHSVPHNFKEPNIESGVIDKEFIAKLKIKYAEIGGFGNSKPPLRQKTKKKNE